MFPSHPTPGTVSHKRVASGPAARNDNIYVDGNGVRWTGDAARNDCGCAAIGCAATHRAVPPTPTSVPPTATVVPPTVAVILATATPSDCHCPSCRVYVRNISVQPNPARAGNPIIFSAQVSQYNRRAAKL